LGVIFDGIPNWVLFLMVPKWVLNNARLGVILFQTRLQSQMARPDNFGNQHYKAGALSGA